MKHILLFACLLCVCCTVRAQVTWNVRAGIGSSDFKGSPLMTTALSYKAGLGTDIPLKGKWALQPSLYFTSRGSRADVWYGYEQIDKIEVTHRLYYLELPVYAVYKLSLGPDVTLNLKAGPYIALGLKGHASISGSDFDNKGMKFSGDLFKDGTRYNEIAQVENKPVYTNPYQRFDAGAGVGVELQVHHFLIGAEGMWGLTSFGRDFEGEKLRHAAAWFTAGYQF